MSAGVKLDFGPDTYFRPQKLERYLLSKVKSAVIRKQLKDMFKAGRHAEVNAILITEGISKHDRQVLESFHPMYMGGNYLPDTDQGEVEIARISIKSTTFDVTCVYARPEDGVIHYRVVDEYGGGYLARPVRGADRQANDDGGVCRLLSGSMAACRGAGVQFRG